MSKRAKTYLAIVIATIVFIFVMRVWPYQIIKNPSTNAHANVTVTEESAFLATRMPVAQMFVTAGEYIQEIKVECNVYSLDKEESVFAVLLDENKEVVYEEVISVKKIKKDGSLAIRPKTECTYGRLYTLELYLVGENSNIAVKTADKSVLGQTEYTEIARFITEGDFSTCILADYTYMAACTPFRMTFYYVVAIMAGIAVWLAITGIGNQIVKNESVYEKTVFLSKTLVTSALIVGYGYAFFQAVIKNIFGGQIYDQVIHGIGMSVLLAFVLYLIWKKKEGKSDEGFRVFAAWIDYLQVVAIALLLHCCVLYQNASSVYMQKTNLEWAGILLGIVVFLQQFDKTVENAVTWLHNKKKKGLLVFLAVQCCLFVALVCYLVYDAQGRYLLGITDPNALYLAKLTCVRNGIWAILLLHTVLYLRPRILRMMSLPMVIVWAFFAIWVWNHQYEYTYVMYIPVYFSLIMLQNWEKKDYLRLLTNMMNGMLLAFFINLTLSLLFRPFQRWIFFRYPMYFHTVACTGEFLVAAEVVVMAKYFLKVKDGSLKKGITELFLLGVVLGYQTLSMARTAIMSHVALVIVGIVVAGIIYHKNWKKTISTLVAFLLIGVITFPTVFSATRIIPALVDNPYRFPIYMEQEYKYGIEKGDPIDDRDYMVFMRFLYCYLDRFTIPSVLEDWLEEQYQEIAEIPQYKNLYLVNNAMADFNVIGNTMFLSADVTNEEKESDKNEISNGRFDIWTAYLSELNMEGHEKIVFKNEDGTEYPHAHNSFIQIAHSFGIPCGISFVVLYLMTFIWSLVYTLRAGKQNGACEENEKYMIALLIVIGFGVSSLTEWLSSLMIPMSMLYWLSIAILSRKPESLDERKKLRTVQKNI